MDYKNKREHVGFAVGFAVRFSLAVIILICIVSNSLAASRLGVEKVVENSDIKAGDDVTIMLRFNNPFGKELPLKIVDKNVFGNNGVDIQCLEYTLPKENRTALAYEPIKPFSEGGASLEPAKVTYTNPETGKEETINSNKLEITVKGPSTQQGTEGITTIFRCNGQNMESTSYSSSGSMQTSISTSQQDEEQSQAQQDAQNRLQNNQMNQNAAAVKQDMAEEAQEEKKLNDAFRKAIEENPDVKSMHNELASKGYNLTEADLKPTSNTSGSFELKYQKQGGEKASMKGTMEEGKLSSLMFQTDEERKQMLDSLLQSEQFKRLDSELKKEGFSAGAPVLNQLSQNLTQISIPYNSTTNGPIIANQTMNATIMADFQRGNLSRINIVRNKQPFPWPWMIFFLLLFSGVAYLLAKRKSKLNNVQLVNVEKPLDYYSDAMKMIERACTLFNEGHEKDAYELVSQAVRFYFSSELKINRELTNSELLSALRKEHSTFFKDVQDCLNLCALVEFAKYTANTEDFEAIISASKKVIVRSSPPKPA